jgi:hypothetical protein
MRKARSRSRHHCKPKRFVDVFRILLLYLSFWLAELYRQLTITMYSIITRVASLALLLLSQIAAFGVNPTVHSRFGVTSVRTLSR